MDFMASHNAVGQRFPNASADKKAGVTSSTDLIMGGFRNQGDISSEFVLIETCCVAEREMEQGKVLAADVRKSTLHLRDERWHLIEEELKHFFSSYSCTTLT